MKKLLVLLSFLLIPSLVFGQVAPVPTATPTATATPRATWSGDKTVANTAAWNTCYYQGGMLIGNPDQMPICLIVGTPGQVLTVGSNLLPSWTNNPTLPGVFSFSGYLPGVADDTGTIVAAGSTITDSIAVQDTFEVVTGADGTKGVHLPPLADVQIGQGLTLVNADLTSLLKVYSNAAGETISGQSGSTAITVAAKLWLLCKKQTASAWHCTKTVAAY